MVRWPSDRPRTSRNEESVELNNVWVRGVARLTRLPVTEKTEGSNPFGPAKQKSRSMSGFFVWVEELLESLKTPVLKL